MYQRSEICKQRLFLMQFLQKRMFFLLKISRIHNHNKTKYCFVLDFEETTNVSFHAQKRQVFPQFPHCQPCRRVTAIDNDLLFIVQIICGFTAAVIACFRRYQIAFKMYAFWRSRCDFIVTCYA